MRLRLIGIVVIATTVAGIAAGASGQAALGRAPSARRPSVHRLAVGGAPIGLLAYRGSLWVANAQTDQVMRIDERTGAVTARVRVGHIPLRLAGVAGRIFSTNWGNGTVSMISTARPTAATTVRLASQPEGIALLGSSPWVVSERTGDLLHVSPAGHALSRVHVGHQPRQVTAAGSDLWVTVFSDNRVVEVNPRTRKLMSRIKTCEGPQGLASASGQLWVACTTGGELVDVDLRSHKVVRRVPYQAADGVRRAGSSLLVTSDDGPSIAMLDPRTGSLSGRTRLSDGFIGDANADVVATGGAIWVSSPDEGAVYKIKPVVP